MKRAHFVPIVRQSKAGVWYPLDASWHPSANKRLSALHLANADDGAACGGNFALLFDDGHSEKDVDSQGRTRCAKCARVQQADRS